MIHYTLLLSFLTLINFSLHSNLLTLFVLLNSIYLLLRMIEPRVDD